jgi:hypothetical protein
MILRRLAEAVRAQSWLTVLLEVMIVVVGLFIGLQVDDWNEWRKDRSAERDYLERLLVETRLNVSQLKVKAQSYFDRADSLSRIVMHISQGSPDQITTNDLTNAFCYWYVPEGVRLQSSTYDEMTATGSLDLITDQSVRQLLQLAWAEHVRAKEENPKLGAIQVDLARPLRRFTEWRFDAPKQNIEEDDNDVPIKAGCVVDRAAMAADSGIASLLVQLNRSQVILGNLHLNEQQALEALLDGLEQALSEDHEK